MTFPALSVLLDDSVSVQLTWTLFHFLWQGLVIAALVFVLNRLIGNRSPRVRYAFGVAGLMAMLVCAGTTWIWMLPLQPTSTMTQAAAHPVMGIATVQESGLPIAMAESEPTPGEIAIVESAPAVSRFVDRWATATTTIYVVGVMLMLCRIAISALGLRHLRVTARAESSIDARLRELTEQIGLRCQPVLRSSARVLVPFVSGVFKPVILLPGFVLSGAGMSSAELDAVILHELAHIRRGDLLINLLQRFTEALLFFHPAVWYVSRTVTIEREKCCDDIVLRHASREAYASALIRLAEACLVGDRVAPLAALAATGARPTQLRRRLLRILGQKPRSSSVRPGIGILSLCLLAVAITGFHLQAQTEAPDSDDDSSVVAESEAVVAERGPGPDSEDESESSTDLPADPELRRFAWDVGSESEDKSSAASDVAYRWPISVEIEEDGTVVATAKRTEFDRLTGLLHQLASQRGVLIRSMQLKPRGKVTVMTLKGNGLTEALRAVQGNYRTEVPQDLPDAKSMLDKIQTDPRRDQNGSFLGPVRIEQAGDAMMIRGRKQDVERVQSIIENIERLAILDQPTENSVAAELNVAIAALKVELAEIQTQFGDQHPRMKMAKKKMQVLERLLEDRKRPQPKRSLAAYKLEALEPTVLREILESIFIDRLKDGLRFNVDAQKKRLFVYAADDVHDAVKGILRDLEKAERNTGGMIRVYPLQRVDATSAVAVLEAMLGDVGGAGLRIDADLASNLVVANGSQEEHELIEELLAKIDRIAADPNTIPKDPKANVLGVVIESPAEGKAGVQIRSVVPRTMAAAAGLKSGDIVLRYDNEKLTTKNMRRIIVGDKDREATLEVERDGQKILIGIHPDMMKETVGEQEDPAAEASSAFDPIDDDGEHHRKMLALGRQLFQKHCVHCHGVNGEGDGPTAAYLNPYPRNFVEGKFRDVRRGTKHGISDLKRVIRTGVNGTAMPSFARLKDEQQLAIALYVDHLAKGGMSDDAEPDSGASSGIPGYLNRDESRFGGKPRSVLSTPYGEFRLGETIGAAMPDDRILNAGDRQGHLRFPVSIERAMMHDSIEPSVRQLR